MNRVQVLSYGGGLDSFAMLLLAMDRGELPDHVVFMDVGDGSATTDGADPGEWPGTYRHIREVVMPLCASLGIPFHWLDSESYPVRNARSLFSWMEARGQIPTSSPGRLCTTIAKVERYERWCAERFAGMTVETWIGFEAGAKEEKRAAKDPNAGDAKKAKKLPFTRVNRFPLIEARLCRCRCEAMARASGLPVPRKSACVFCPYGTLRDWQTMAKELPEHFARTVALEANKPMTKARPEKGKISKKLSIKAFRTLKDAEGNEIGYRYTPLPVFIDQKPKAPKAEPCDVCGAAQRATKAPGCGYVGDEPTYGAVAPVVTAPEPAPVATDAPVSPGRAAALKAWETRRRNAQKEVA